MSSELLKLTKNISIDIILTKSGPEDIKQNNNLHEVINCGFINMNQSHNDITNVS